MIKLSNRMKTTWKEIDKTKQYEFSEAIQLLKKFSTPKFIETVDVSINLGINPRKPEQNVRGTTILPCGIGRPIRVIVFSQGKNAEDAKLAGADEVGTENLIKDVKSGKKNFDVVFSTPDVMHIVSQLSQILGPRGLMPNPKLGTVTSNIFEAVKNAKKGQIYYRNDKNGIIHTVIGKINFDIKDLKKNLETLLISLKQAKPSQTKGTYFKKINVSTTMGVGIFISQNNLIY